MIKLTKYDIQEAIFLGLENACKDAYHFTGEVNAKIKPEYIVTVNIAKGLFSLNKGETGYGYGIIIKFEEPTATFATACVPRIIVEDLFNMKLGSLQNTERNGKIDICIYNESGERPICPIEVKDFNPSKGEVLSDIKRNLQLMQLDDTQTGGSILDYAFISTLEEHKNCFSKKNVDSGLKKVKLKYEKWVKPFNDNLTDIVISVDVKTVAHQLIGPDTNFQGMDDMEIADRVAETYHFIGVIITLDRKSKT
jgi:hypothetical protein